MSTNKYSVEFVLMGCIAMLMLTYLITDNLDEFFSPKECYEEKGHVEVTLEKIPEPVVEIAPVEKIKLIKTNKKVSLTKKEFDCLARNVFYEAGVESYVGKVSVATVTYNRLVAGKWGDSFCKVVHQKNQFSWTNKNVETPHGPLWEASKDAVVAFSKGIRVTKIEKSDHYHATYINPPAWANRMKFKARIGNHVFYAER